jgi:hypothetical protein
MFKKIVSAGLVIGLGALLVAPLTAEAAPQPAAPAVNGTERPTDSADPLLTEDDCKHGCKECQKDCGSSNACDTACVNKWASCCESIGKKAYTGGSCGCHN